MNIRFIKSSEKKKLLAELNQEFGITSMPYLLFETGKGKIRGYSGDLSKEEILQLGKLTNIEIMGTYLLRKEREDDIRLSFDAPMILKSQITKNLVEIDNEQLDEWLHGKELPIKTNIHGPVIIKNNNDLVGCGKSNGEKVFNYVPKDRRLRN